MHKPQVILRGQTMKLFYEAAQLSANSLKKNGYDDGNSQKNEFVPGTFVM